MGTTGNYTWTYPDSTSNTSIWTHFKTLADGVDASLKTVDNKVAYADYRVLTVAGGSSGSPISFTAIPGTLRTIRLDIMARGDTAALYTNPMMRFAGDSGNFYGTAYSYIINPSTTSTASSTNQSAINMGYVPCASQSANRFGSLVVWVNGWNLPNSRVSGLQINYQGGFVAGTNWLSVHGVGEYVGTAFPATKSIQVYAATGNFVAGTQITLTGTY